MGVSLTSDSGSFRSYNLQTWCGILDLAMAYGWKPAGTEDPLYEAGDDDWNGSYTYNCGQCITASDAASIADALDLVLLDPEIDAGVGRDDPFGEYGSDPFGEGTPLPTAARFPGPAGKDGIRALIRFCRKGFIWID
jgi:hypothetical protein